MINAWRVTLTQAAKPGQADAATALRCGAPSEIEPVPQDEFQNEMIGGSGHADAGAEIDFPLRREVQINGGKDGMLLFTERIKAPDRAQSAIVFNPRLNLGMNVVTEFEIGRELDAA